MDNQVNIKIHKSADVSDHADIGSGTSIWNNAQVREGAKIGEFCVISKDVYIDTMVCIGSYVKIQNGVSVYKGVTIEDNVFLGPHMTFTNDFYPRAFNTNWKITKTLVEKGASIGANATIVCGSIIGEYAMVAAGSVVTKDVPAYGLVMGNPARLKGFVCKCGYKLEEFLFGQTFEENNKIMVGVCKECNEHIEIPIEIYNKVNKL